MVLKTLQTRLNRLGALKKNGMLAYKYSKVLYGVSMIGKHGKYHFRQWYKNGGTFSLTGTDREALACDLLYIVFGVDYKSGNDSPRGGQEGYYIEISPRSKKKVLNCLELIETNLLEK